MRKYIGFYDDGHDYGEFYYYSSHRNYSKSNMQDMENEYRKRFGYSRYSQVKFSFGYLVKD